MIQGVHTVDGRNPAPLKKLWNDASPVVRWAQSRVPPPNAWFPISLPKGPLAWVEKTTPWTTLTSGRRKSPHVALSHPSHPQPLGTTHIRLSHPMRFKPPHFLQNTMGTELEGRCCQPQQFTAHCAHMLKTHWFGFMLNAFPGQNPIGHSVFCWLPQGQAFNCIPFAEPSQG